MTTHKADAAEVVTLRGGLCVPLVVLQLAWRLEEQGIEMRVDGHDVIVRPAQRVSTEDRQLLKKHVRELKQLVAYVDNPPEVRM